MKRMSLRAHLTRAAAVLACLALLLSAGAVPAAAYTAIDTGAKASLTAVFDGAKTEKTEFRLYRVAEVSETARFTLSGAFASASVDLSAVDSASGWADMAVTLDAYAGSSKISPTATGTTSGGKVTFSDLTVGLYLLEGDAVVSEGYTYTPAPAMIMLPTLTESDTWDYTPSVTVKYDKALAEEPLDVTARKVWNDGNRSGRPTSVTVQLLRNGAVQETVVLNKDNNWTYTWEDLPGTYEVEGKAKPCTYTVSEQRVPAGYTVSVSQEGDTFKVTNTYRTTTTDNSKLPQTGTLNWPIPVLTVAGLVLMVTGWYLLTRRKEG